MKNSYSFSNDQIFKLIKHYRDLDEYKMDYDSQVNRIVIHHKAKLNVIKIKLPWMLPAVDRIDDILQNINSDYIQKIVYQIILIQAGYAAIGNFEYGKLIDHKLVRKYMVRKKQGKAQITYLHTKGKSRAGSRIRLKQTIQFFEEINLYINSWLKKIEPDRLLISCPPRLWGLLFRSKVKPGFDKKDDRLIKIPVDVNIPDTKELIRLNNIAQRWTVELDNYYLNLITEFI